MLIRVLCLLLSLISCILAKDYKNRDEDLFCAVLNPLSGTYIDLSQLSSTPNEEIDPKKKRKESSKTRWLVKGWGDDIGKNFTISICSSPISDNDNSEKDPNQKPLSNSTGAFYSMNGIYESIGDFSVKPQLFGTNNKKLTLKYENGSKCPNSAYKKSTLLNFVCDREITSKAQMSYIGNLNNCSYFFEIRSIYACPTSNKSNEINVIGIFFGIFAVFFIVEYGRRTMQKRLMLKDNLTNRIIPASASSSTSTSTYNQQFMNSNESQPNWEFFDNQSNVRKLLRSFERGLIIIISPIVTLISKSSNRNRRNTNNSDIGARSIRLYSSPLGSNSQTSFLRDMEIQNNILDSLEVQSNSGASNNNNDNTGDLINNENSLS